MEHISCAVAVDAATPWRGIAPLYAPFRPEKSFDACQSPFRYMPVRVEHALWPSGVRVLGDPLVVILAQGVNHDCTGAAGFPLRVAKAGSAWSSRASSSANSRCFAGCAASCCFERLRPSCCSCALRPGAGGLALAVGSCPFPDLPDSSIFFEGRAPARERQVRPALWPSSGCFGVPRLGST